MNISANLRTLRVIIVTHVYATGPSHALEEYLRRKAKNLAFIGHPFVFTPEKRSHLRTYDEKGRMQEAFFPWYVPVQLFNLIKDIVLTVWWCAKFGPIDLFIGVNNINASVGIVLQKLGLVKKTVFYTIDYIPNRFPNRLVNALYHILDIFAVRHVDMVWNLSSIMARERKKQGLDSKKLKKKQIVVPVGTDETVPPLSFGKIQRYHLAHMGHLTRKQGVQLVIEAIPYIIKHLPKFHLDIIGGGPMLGELKQRVKALGVTKYVTFYGFIKGHDDVGRLLARCAAAVAPYVDSPDNFVRYTDPGKVKAYLAVGLPIVITKVPDVWEILVDKKAGMAALDTPADLSRAIVAVLSNEKKLRQYRQNAAILGKEYLWSTVFKKAFAQTLT